MDARERNQPHRLLKGDFEEVLHRPIETARVIGMWPNAVQAHLPWLWVIDGVLKSDPQGYQQHDSAYR
jgi:hypothetical protein